MPLLISFTAFNQMEHANGKTVIECSPTFNPFEVTELGIMAIKPSGEGERSRKMYHREYLGQWYVKRKLRILMF